jgi:hypothetical protein
VNSRPSPECEYSDGVNVFGPCSAFSQSSQSSAATSSETNVKPLLLGKFEEHWPEPISLTFVFSAPGFEDTMRSIPWQPVRRPLRSPQRSKKTLPMWDMPKPRAGQKSPRKE